MTNIHPPLVSILCLTSNSWPEIQKCIESIYEQTYENWELIILHDKRSMDETEQFMRNLSDRRVKIFYHEEDNTAIILNRGIQLCSGKYIARIEYKDRMLKNRLKIQVEFLENNCSFSACGGATKSTTNANSGENTWDYFSSPEIIRIQLLFSQPFSTSSIMYKSSLIKDYGYDQNFSHFNDYDLLTRLARNTDIYCLKDYIISSDSDYPLDFFASEETVKDWRKINQSLHDSLPDVFTLSENYSIFSENWEKMTEEDSEFILQDFICAMFRLYKTLSRQTYPEISLKTALIWYWKIANMMIAHRFFRGYFNQTKRYEFLFKLMFSVTNTQRTITTKDIPLVSVVMPTYKVTAEVYQSLKTLSQQTFQNFEVLIVNDGKPDFLNYVLDLISDSRFKLLQTETRLGLANSLNYGIQKSRAKYIARADADDWYLPERLERQVNFLEKHQDISFCSTGQYTLLDDGRCITEIFPEKHEQIKATLLFYCCISHTSCMWNRTAFIEKNLFYDSSYIIEDFELWNRAVHKVKFYCLPQPLVYYRYSNKASRTSQIDLMRIDLNYRLIFTNTLKKAGVDTYDSDIDLFAIWFRTISPDDPLLVAKVLRFKEILLELLHKNKVSHVYDQKALEKCAYKRWKEFTQHLPNKSAFHIKKLADKKTFYDNIYFQKSTLQIKRYSLLLLTPIMSYMKETLTKGINFVMGKLIWSIEYVLDHKLFPHIDWWIRKQSIDYLKNEIYKLLPPELSTKEKKVELKNAIRKILAKKICAMIEDEMSTSTRQSMENKIGDFIGKKATRR